MVRETCRGVGKQDMGLVPYEYVPDAMFGYLLVRDHLTLEFFHDRARGEIHCRDEAFSIRTLAHLGRILAGKPGMRAA